MASARAIIASERPILADYVTDGENALLVPPEDSNTLAAAIQRVLADRTLASRLGSAARHGVEDGLTTGHFAEQIAPVLRAAQL